MLTFKFLVFKGSDPVHLQHFHLFVFLLGQPETQLAAHTNEVIVSILGGSQEDVS